MSRRRTFIALLRGINVGGHNKIPMSELRALCTEIGWGDVRSYIQSGNLVFSSAASATALEKKLEQSIERQFGLSIPVIVREAAKWSTYVQGNPFPDASAKEPNLVSLGVSRNAPKAHAAKQLRERATHGERVVQVDDILWAHFPNGVARSRLSPALFDRLVGSTVTMRNWRTVRKLEELAGPPTDPGVS